MSLWAADWPENYVVQGQSISPAKKYAVVVRSRELVLESKSVEQNPVYLANIQEHRVLGRVTGVDYFESENHRGLRIYWAADSTWCVMESDSRFGFQNISVLKIHDNRLSQMEIGDRIQKTVNEAIAKQSHQGNATAEITPYFRIGANRAVKVRAVATTNPKELSDMKSYYAHFAGIYDLKSKRWIFANARPASDETHLALLIAYDDHFDEHMIVAPNGIAREGFSGSIFLSEQQKVHALNHMLTNVWDALQAILSKERFAELEAQDKMWLAELDRVESAKEKSVLQIARIHELQDLLWQP